MTPLRVSLAFFALCLASPSGLAQTLRMDTPTVIAGVETVCTGASLDARQDPRWDSYGLKVEFAGAGGRYLGDESLTLRKAGAPLLDVTCSGPWLLFRLPPGRYDVEARIASQNASSAAFVPATGQGRIILRFPDSE